MLWNFTINLLFWISQTYDFCGKSSFLSNLNYQWCCCFFDFWNPLFSFTNVPIACKNTVRTSLSFIFRSINGVRDTAHMTIDNLMKSNLHKIKICFIKRKIHPCCICWMIIGWLLWITIICQITQVIHRHIDLIILSIGITIIKQYIMAYSLWVIF